jgi:hypothetical protein
MKVQLFRGAHAPSRAVFGAFAENLLVCGLIRMLVRHSARARNAAREARALPNPAVGIEVVKALNASTVQRLNVVTRRSEAKP